MKAIQVSTMFLIGIALANGVPAQTQSHAHNHLAQKGAVQSKPDEHMQTMMDAKMMVHCHEMMQKHEQMQADMKAMDEKLNGLVSSMNSASGAEKTDAIAAVVNEMAAQRKTMQDQMSSMQTGMMQHMMEHMQTGKKSMSMCPMMQAMQTSHSGSKTPDEHAKHH